MARIAVIGSRDYPDMDKVGKAIAALPANTVIVTGGWWDGNTMRINPTRGVDRAAAEAGRACGLTVVLVAADWARYRKQAGFRRNPVILDCSDSILAFWDGESRGTKHGIDYAKKKHMTIEIILPESEDA